MAECCNSAGIRIEKIRGNRANKNEVNKNEADKNEKTSERASDSTSGPLTSRLTDITAADTAGVRKSQVVLPRDQMQNILGGNNITGNQGNQQTEEPIQNNNGGNILIPTGTADAAPIFENPPTLAAPANPLLPPGYQEVVDYNDLQYVNGFFRTQIGRYVKVDCLVGSNQIVVKYGYLIAVGINYILLQEAGTGNILSVDFWSIKFMYIYYDEEELRRVIPFTS